MWNLSVLSAISKLRTFFSLQNPKTARNKWYIFRSPNNKKLAFPLWNSFVWTSMSAVHTRFITSVGSNGAFVKVEHSRNNMETINAIAKKANTHTHTCKRCQNAGHSMTISTVISSVYMTNIALCNEMNAAKNVIYLQTWRVIRPVF